MDLTRRKPAFDNNSFQVHLFGEDIELYFGDEYAFYLSDLLELLDFLKSVGVRLE